MSGIRKNFYNSIPKLFKAFFNEQEIIEAINNNDPFGYEKTDVSRKADDEMIDILYTSIYMYSDIKSTIKSLGFDGPDDTSIISCYKDIDENTLYLTGSFRFCVYDGTQENFKKLLNKLDQYTYSGSTFGNLIIKDVSQTLDTYGISFDAINNTDKTRWISANYEFSYDI